MSGGRIQTVRGPIDANELGVCLPQEHLLLNLEWIDARFSLDGIVNDEAMVLDELRTVPAAGSQSIIDPTSTGLRPDPLGVRRLSEPPACTS